MTVTELKDFLGWCTVINYGVVTVWFLGFVWAHDALFRLHTRWFKLTPERFNAINYAAMAVYKIGILLLNLVPWVALHAIS